jgi:hypothetical protein
VAYDIAILDAEGRYVRSGSDPRYLSSGVIGEALGLEWGGRWTRPYDPAHFQLTRGVDLQTMRSRFETGRDVFTGR